MRIRKEVIFAILFILILSFNNLIFADSKITTDNNYVSGEIIVKYKEGIKGNGKEVIDYKNNELIIYEYLDEPVNVVKILEGIELYKLKFDTDNVEKIVENYKSMKEIEYAEPNYIYESFIVPNDAGYSLKDDLLNINAENAWNLTTGNVSVVIAIIDTGVDWDHPDLSLNIWNNSDEDCDDETDLDNNSYFGDCRGYDFVDVNSGCSSSDDCLIEDNDPMDFNGHGTHVSGIAAAVSDNGVGTTGVCWNCSIMPVRAGYENDAGSGVLAVDDVVQALYYASDNNATVISMSFGGSHSSAVDAAINHSFYNNSILVAAAGNSGVESKQYPCAYDNVICVAAVSDDNTSWSSSNFGAWVDLAAPGVTIYSTEYNDTYSTQSGTSMSTPIVSGAIGLIKSLFDKNQTEINDALNNTGIAVNFSSVLINRIDVYSAILSLDDKNPNVSLINPLNNHINLTLNQTFSCNATDWQLSNMTLEIWNSTNNLFYNESKNISGIENESVFNVSMNYDSYKWNCLSYDLENNKAYALSNFSLIIGNITSSLISPVNNTFQNTTESNFNCSAESIPDKSLNNLTFDLWNSSNSLVYNSSVNLSGTFDSNVFNYNFSYDDNYLWNCLAYNNESESSFAISNYTINYDTIYPNVSLLDPENSSSYTSSSQTIVFGYNASDSNDISNCSLYVDGSISITNNSVNNNQIQNFSNSFTPGNYNWSIGCYDKAVNYFNSETRNFKVNAPTVSSSSSGGGGGGGGSSAGLSKTHVIDNEQISSGYTQKLSKNDKIKFTFFDDKSSEHALVINEIGNNYINITINSNPINLKLGVGQSIKLNLTNPYYYDLFIKLISIEKSKAEIMIQSIHEEFNKEIISNNTDDRHYEEMIDEVNDKDLENLNFEINKLKNTINILVLTIILTAIIIVLKEREYISNVIEKVSDDIKEKIKV